MEDVCTADCDPVAGEALARLVKVLLSIRYVYSEEFSGGLRHSWGPRCPRPILRDSAFIEAARG
jgi:hypothetical protein